MATSFKGQGVGSAYLEQVDLVSKLSDDFNILLRHKRGKADIYHIHTINPTYYLRMRKKRANIVYVHYIPDTLKGSIRLPKFLFKAFSWYIIKFYKKADEIVVVNPTFKKDLVELGMKEECVTYIPNYVSFDNFFPLKQDEINAAKDFYKIDKEKFVVLGVGQIQNRKGVEDFIDVAKRNPDIQFIWAGGFTFGLLTDGYEKLKKITSNPPPNVKFLGIIDREKMNEIYNISNCLFMPSFTELFPMSILEACNVGKPILLRDLPLYEDILYDMYEKGSNIEEFCDIINCLKNNSASYQKASSNSIRIKEFYSKEHVSSLWKDYYLRVYEKYKDRRKK